MDVSLVAIVWMDPGLETRRLSNNNWYDLCNEGNVMEKNNYRKVTFSSFEEPAKLTSESIYF